MGQPAFKTETEAALEPIVQQLGRIAAAIEQNNKLLTELVRQEEHHAKHLGAQLDGIAETCGRIADGIKGHQEEES